MMDDGREQAKNSQGALDFEQTTLLSEHVFTLLKFRMEKPYEIRSTTQNG